MMFRDSITIAKVGARVGSSPAGTLSMTSYIDGITHVAEISHAVGNCTHSTHQLWRKRDNTCDAAGYLHRNNRKRKSKAATLIDDNDALARFCVAGG